MIIILTTVKNKINDNKYLVIIIPKLNLYVFYIQIFIN